MSLGYISPDYGDVWLIWLRDNQQTMIRQIFQGARKGPRSVRLQPLNHTLEPYYERPENIRYIGRVLTVIRDYEHGRHLRTAGSTCGG